MNDFDVLLTGPVLPVIREGLEARFAVHKLFEQEDREAFITGIAPKIRAMVGGHGAGRITGELMARFPKLQIVGNFGVGYDGVDAKWAGEHGVLVTNTPDVLNEEVADLAMGLLIATTRRLPQADRYVRAGQWLKGPFPLSSSLRGKRMGILGLGRIGKAIARRAEAFGLSICYHGRRPQTDLAYPYYATLEAMAREIDILMIITPGGAETRGLVSRAVMEALGQEGTLINVARGSVVDEQAMIALLAEGKLGAAGLDVFEDEPRVPEALFSMENVVLLPHIGSASVHTRNAMGQLVVDNLVSFAEGRGPLTPVPETPWRG